MALVEAMEVPNPLADPPEAASPAASPPAGTDGKDKAEMDGTVAPGKVPAAWSRGMSGMWERFMHNSRVIYYSPRTHKAFIATVTLQSFWLVVSVRRALLCLIGRWRTHWTCTGLLVRSAPPSAPPLPSLPVCFARVPSAAADHSHCASVSRLESGGG